MITETPSPRRTAADRRRMALALLAGGLVLGVGTAVTLAIWNDSEFATGTFSAGEFDLEGSTDGTAFSSSPDAPGKTLTFDIDADLLSPGAVVYAPFSLQLSADSDYSASIDVSSAVSGTIGSDLTYSVYTDSDFDAACSAAAPPTGPALISDRAADAAGAVADAFTLAAAETPTDLCIVVTAGPDVEQGATGSVTWEFAGESGAPLP